MLIKLYEENPSQKQVIRIAEILRRGGIIIYPTDTVYGMGCDITCQKAIEQIARLKNIKPENANFSFICYDLSHASGYCRPLSNQVFKLMKKNLPGPFTFVVEANNKTPRLLKSKKKTVGIRIPDNMIIREIVRELGNPVLSTSVYDDDSIIEYTTDPELIYERFKGFADVVVDGGYGGNVPSTVVDCTGNEINVLREGKGVLIE